MLVPAEYLCPSIFGIGRYSAGDQEPVHIKAQTPRLTNVSCLQDGKEMMGAENLLQWPKNVWFKLKLRPDGSYIAWILLFFDLHF